MVGIPTLVIDIYAWTGQGPNMPFSAHHILVISAACFASLTPLLWLLGLLFDWLDDRQAARLAAAAAQEDARAAALVDELAGRMHSFEAEYTEALKQLATALREGLVEAHAQGSIDNILGRTSRALRPVN